MTTLRLSASGARARRRPWAGNRTVRRLRSDPQALLALGHRHDHDRDRRDRSGRRCLPSRRDQRGVPRRPGDRGGRGAVPPSERQPADDDRVRSVCARHPLRHRGDRAAADRGVPADGRAVHPDRGARGRPGSAAGDPRRIGRGGALSPAGPVGHAGQHDDRRPARRRARWHGHPALDRNAAVHLRPDGDRPPARRVARARSPPLPAACRRRGRRPAAGGHGARTRGARADRRPAPRRPRLRLRLRVSSDRRPASGSPPRRATTRSSTSSTARAASSAG